MKPSFFLAAVFAISCYAGSVCSAQETVTINGIVTSFKSIPLNNVRIFARGSRETQVTDSTGRFIIKCAPKDILVISASGFTQKNIKTGKKATLQIDLPYGYEEGSYEMAISHKHIRPDVLEKAISGDVKRKEKDFSRYTSIFELVAAEVYDVRVTGSSVYNRKIKSMDMNPQVLYVVDNKIVPDIAYITPVDVKTIEFVDDVGATIYGVLGANGVLKITLK